MVSWAQVSGAAAVAIAAAAALAISIDAVGADEPSRQRPADGNATLLVLPASISHPAAAADAADAAAEAES